MSKPTLNKRRPSFPSSAPDVVLSNVDTPATAHQPPMALIKHGKYVLAGVGGMWYTGFTEAVGSVLNVERAWIRSVSWRVVSWEVADVIGERWFWHLDYMLLLWYVLQEKEERGTDFI
jgi:hypothetical protein